VAALLPALLLSGCKKPAAKKAAEDEKPIITRPSGGGGGGVMATLPAVDRANTQNYFKNFFLFYKDQCDTGKPPASLDDMKDLRLQAPPKLVEPFKDGRYVVYWKADTRKTGGDAGKAVLAHVHDVETRGGVVLLLDGTIVPNMPAEDFKKAPKAGKGP
jgi:hypothetical protein